MGIQTPFGEKFTVNADFTASGMLHDGIERFMQTQIHPFYSNTHSNAHNGKLMAHYMEESRRLIRKSIHAKQTDKIIFSGNGCSGAVTHLIHSLNLRQETSPQTVVFVSVAEHHSNYLPWTHLPVVMEIIPTRNDGVIDLAIMKDRLAQYEGHPIICSFIAGSNVTGVVQPVHAISKLVHRANGLIFFDYAACAPYVSIDMHQDDATMSYFDAIFISPHKFLGGPGSTGVLVASNKLFRNEEPYCPGGGTVRFVCKDFQHYSANTEVRESGGTPNILGCIKAGLVFQLKDEMLPRIQKREHEINRRVRDFFAGIPCMDLINPPESTAEQVPIYSFRLKGVHYNLIVALLNDLFGIQSRGGVSCCSVFAQYLLHINRTKQEKIYHQIVGSHGVPEDYGWCRVTFHYSMTDEIVDYILHAIKFVCKYHSTLAPLYKYLPDANNWTHRSFDRKFPALDYHRGDGPVPKTITLTHEILSRQLADAAHSIGNLRLGKSDVAAA